MLAIFTELQVIKTWWPIHDGRCATHFDVRFSEDACLSLELLSRAIEALILKFLAFLATSENFTWLNLRGTQPVARNVY